MCLRSISFNTSANHVYVAVGDLPYSLEEKTGPCKQPRKIFHATPRYPPPSFSWMRDVRTPRYPKLQHPGSKDSTFSDDIDIFQALRKLFLPHPLLGGCALLGLLLCNGHRERHNFRIFVESIPAKHRNGRQSDLRILICILAWTDGLFTPSNGCIRLEIKYSSHI